MTVAPCCTARRRDQRRDCRPRRCSCATTPCTWRGSGHGNRRWRSRQVGCRALFVRRDSEPHAGANLVGMSRSSGAVQHSCESSLELLARRTDGAVFRWQAGPFRAVHVRANTSGCLRPAFLDAAILSSYGAVLKAKKMFVRAQNVLCESVHAYPLNWSAWTDLASVCRTREAVRRWARHRSLSVPLTVASVGCAACGVL